MPPPDACDPHLRAVGILASCLFPIPCTTLFLPLPVHGPDLPPLLHRFAAKLQTFAAISMSIWRQIAPVPARRLRRSRTVPTPFPHDIFAVPARRPCAYLADGTTFPSLPKTGNDSRLPDPCTMGLVVGHVCRNCGVCPIDFPCVVRWEQLMPKCRQASIRAASPVVMHQLVFRPATAT